jgi:hypothetical protein
MRNSLVVFGLLLAGPPLPAQDAPFGNPATTRPDTNLVLNESFGSAKPGATVTQLGTGSAETDLFKHWMPGQDGWLGEAATDISIRPDCLFVALAYDPTPVPPGFQNSGKPTGWGSAFQLTSEMARQVALIPDADGKSTYLEAREKLPKSKEAWPCIWVYCNHDDYVAHPESRSLAELDVFETNEIFYKDHVFRPDMICSTSHGPDGKAVDQKWIAPGPAVLADDYHVYGCEIVNKAGNLYWSIFFDGKLQFTSKKEWKWPAPPPTLIFGCCAVLKDTQQPSVPNDGTSIDWVRVWRN